MQTASFSGIMSSPGQMMSSPGHMMSSDSHNMMSSPNHMISSPHHMKSSPSHMMSSASHIMSSASHMMASPNHMISSPNRMMSSPSHMISSPSHMMQKSSPIMTSPQVMGSRPVHMKQSPSSPLCHVTPSPSPARPYIKTEPGYMTPCSPIMGTSAGLPSPPPTPITSFFSLPTLLKTSPHPAVTPSRDVLSPSRGAAVLSPPISLSPGNGLSYQTTGLPQHPFICSVSTVRSLAEATPERHDPLGHNAHL